VRADALALGVVLAIFASRRGAASARPSAKPSKPRKPTPLPSAARFPNGAPGQGQHLEPDNVLELAQEAGFKGDALRTATAIALTESGGWVSFVRHVKGKTARYGLWQIPAEMNPEAQEVLTDPQQNAKIAFERWKREGFSAWPSYRDKSYLRAERDL